ncbi:MAG: hypothetical protein IJU43_00690 [Lachnospiraceae bacterium]|nr:hypothetical protein [Lachnospiraceae bacterium]
MVAKFLVFLLIWILLTAFGTFMGYGLFPDRSIFETGVIACLIAWVVSIIITVLRSVTKGEIDTQKLLTSKHPDYEAYPGDVANHSVGFEEIGGHLHFFPESLVFHPAYKDKVQLQDWIIDYKDIADVRQGPSINKIVVEAKDGAVDVFAVHSKDKWISQIRTKMKSSSEG